MAERLAQAEEASRAQNPADSNILAERDRLLEQQRQIMQLLGSKSPDKILHDLRNLLNELGLLRTLVESEEE